MVNHHDWFTSPDGIKWVSEGSSCSPRRNGIWESTSDSSFIQLTLLVIYDDGLCSLCYTTDLLKNGCLASIGSSYDENAKMGTSISSLSTVISSTCAAAKNQLMSFSREGNILAHQMQLHQQFLPSPIFSLVRGDGLYDEHWLNGLSDGKIEPRGQKCKSTVLKRR